MKMNYVEAKNISYDCFCPKTLEWVDKKQFQNDLHVVTTDGICWTFSSFQVQVINLIINYLLKLLILNNFY